ncbi:hypothetical protein DERP_005480 [Dermatophagoides pteronyssinus]|uniref:Uncharacterized protein n=1 Tax=Dermatophagoides pteronyssinus TaxID=6956 RepID=A0ABQ8JNL4_DERPT|nr:hypothetical protein DERP_005480 [Dermatophagoides pteronyssinus]
MEFFFWLSECSKLIIQIAESKKFREYSDDNYLSQISSIHLYALRQSAPLRPIRIASKLAPNGNER